MCMRARARVVLGGFAGTAAGQPNGIPKGGGGMEVRDICVR